MNLPSEEIHKRIQNIQNQLGSYNVTIVGATKYQSADTVAAGIQLGITHLGVNYVQQGEALYEMLQGQLKPEIFKALKWHFIGGIQSRKAKLLGLYDLIESLDRISVAEKIPVMRVPKRVLVQVNIGEETQKSGVLPGDLETFLLSLETFAHIKPIGLMSMPPAIEPVEKRRPYFKKLRTLFETYFGTVHGAILSMGTTDDYLIAAEEGSNEIRLGTSLYGQRPPQPTESEQKKETT